MRISDWSSDVCSSDLPEPTCDTPSSPRRRSVAGSPHPTCDTPSSLRRQAVAGSDHCRNLRHSVVTPPTGCRRFGWRGLGGDLYAVLGPLLGDGEGGAHGVHELEIGRASCRERVWQYV